MKRETQCSKTVEHIKSSSKGEIYGDISLPLETRKISNKQPNFKFKGTRKKRTNKAQRKEILMIRVEINEVET